MTRPADRFLSIATVTLALLAGCRHVSVAESAAETQSSFQFIPPRAPPPTGKTNLTASVAPSRQVLTDARPALPLATPLYPTEARAAKLGLVTMTMRLTIDSAGLVAEIVPSLAGFSVPNRFSDQFRQSVEAAVTQWRFTPAEIQYLEEAPIPTGGTYLRVARREKIEAVCDVQFTFTSTGAVVSGASPSRK